MIHLLCSPGDSQHWNNTVMNWTLSSLSYSGCGRWVLARTQIHTYTPIFNCLLSFGFAFLQTVLCNIGISPTFSLTTPEKMIRVFDMADVCLSSPVTSAILSCASSTQLACVSSCTVSAAWIYSWAIRFFPAIHNNNLKAASGCNCVDSHCDRERSKVIYVNVDS